MWLHEAARALNASAVGPDVEITSVSTDTRSLKRGALFIALKGPNFDGHAFAVRAIEAGAGAVMIEAGAELQIAPALVVENTHAALGRLAAWHRARMPAKIAAITGSNGKTTVKEMLASICRAEVGEAAMLATEGNLNNDIGVPLTLLRLTPEHRYAVVEMGMNHPGELAYLTHLAQPDVALVNNALRAHLEGMGTVEAVARAKAEIYGGLKADGMAIINADDPHADLWRSLNTGHGVMTFGFQRGADVRVRSMEDTAVNWQLAKADVQLSLQTPVGRIETSIRTPGEHNLANAGAAAAAALALGLSPVAIASGLAAYAGIKGRLQPHECIHGATLIDDTYNANPDSVLAAIQVLAARPGARILVLGDMGELGAGAKTLHWEVGEKAKAAGIDRLLCLGELSAHTAAGFGAGGMHFERIEELLAEVEQALAPDVTVLVKGSRFMWMERVVKSFVESRLCAASDRPGPGAAPPPAAMNASESGDSSCS